MLITSVYAGLLALWFLVLSLRVVAYRRGEKIHLGDGGDALMQRRIRGHGNFAEYVPLILVLMLLLESGHNTPTWLLHGIGITLLVSRVLHGIAFGFTQHFVLGRVLGTMLSFALLLLTGVLCLCNGVGGLMLSGG